MLKIWFCVLKVWQIAKIFSVRTCTNHFHQNLMAKWSIWIFVQQFVLHANRFDTNVRAKVPK